MRSQEVGVCFDIGLKYHPVEDKIDSIYFDNEKLFFRELSLYVDFYFKV